MVSRVIATGSFVPEAYMTNDNLSKLMDTSHEWIKSRTGIDKRHIVKDQDVYPEDELKDKLLYISAQACEKALDMASKKANEIHDRFNNGCSFEKSDIDLIIAATSTSDYIFPSLSCRLQNKLMLKCAAVDMSLACSGFLAALQAADAYIKSGMYKNILVVGADIMSRIVDWSDRNTSILFGDAAGAVVISGDERMNPDSRNGIICSKLVSDGSGDKALYCRAMYFNESDSFSIKMDGRKVFEFAVKRVPEVIRAVISEAKEKYDFSDEPKYYVLHQANLRIIETVARRLKKPMECFPHNIENYANTTAATIPVLLDELNRAGNLVDGDSVVCSGFGAGLSYGACIMRW